MRIGKPTGMVTEYSIRFDVFHDVTALATDKHVVQVRGWKLEVLPEVLEWLGETGFKHRLLAPEPHKEVIFRFFDSVEAKLFAMAHGGLKVQRKRVVDGLGEYS